ncbi:retropepsin-like aspartic protease [Sphingomonas sp. PR090111-T3T-6A]|uniref:retropepsin-like aspartic protease n=1 Tax=Sphingomonas sp. PR090111-T3T-6A TaxID=685778 RepID=UPI0003A13692|nr:retropepsin-like aspartic protease [Sphingomonas sp. PR090111-T3T-6A]
MPLSTPAAALAAFLALVQSPPAAPLTTGVTLQPPPPAPGQPLPDAAAAPEDASSTAVPLHDADQRMTVKVMINGSGPFRFIVDSGATRTVISRRLATLLGLPSAGTVTLHSVGGESQVAAVKIASLSLSDMPSQPIIAPVLTEADLGGVGILGIDVLANKRVVIDLRNNQMKVEPARHSRSPTEPGEIVVTARRRYGQLVLADADAVGTRIYAVIDTGSSVTLGNIVLRDKLVRRKRAQALPVDIIDVAGHVIKGHYAQINDIRLGTTHIQQSTIAFSDAHAFERFGLDKKPSMLVGMDLLRSFDRVSIDFKNKTVSLITSRQSIG